MIDAALTLMASPQGDGNSRIMPLTSSKSGPKDIEVAYNVNWVSNIDAKTNTFEVDAEVDFFWNEPKAIGKPEGTVLKLKEEEMFDPQIYVTNAHELEHHKYVTTVLDSTSGDVICRVRYQGTLYISRMDLSLFPFDCQNLQIGLRTTRLEAEKVLLHAHKGNSSLHHHGVHEWTILDHLMKSFLTDPALSSAHKEYSIMFVTVLVQRQSIWFVNNIFVISTMLVVYSWASYIYEPEERREKMFIIFCSILSMMENKFAVGNSLPKVDYRTLVDCYVDVCCLCIFISAFSAFITKFVYEEDHDEELAWEVNGILFAINISILFVAVIYVCVRVRNVHDGISEWLGHAETRRKEINSSECIVEDIDAASNSDKKNHKRDRRASAFLDVGGGRKTHSKTSSNNNKYRILNALADAKSRLEKVGFHSSLSLKSNESRRDMSEADKRQIAAIFVTAAIKAHSTRDKTGSGSTVKVKPSQKVPPSKGLFSTRNKDAQVLPLS